MAYIASEVRRTISTLRSDIRTSDFGATFRRETKEISDFYLTGEQRTRLRQMPTLHRMFLYSWWVFKALFFRLTPVRRLLFVAGILLLFNFNLAGERMTISTEGFAGGLLLVFLILLELKDKLLAHDELHEGRHIQQMLMPEQVQRFEGWSVYLYTRPANEVCGDLVDFLPLTSSHAAVAIADVAGKGLHAALLTAKLQSTLRALAFDDLPLGTLIARINSIFHRDAPARLFASLIYAVIGENEGALRFVNAGHLPPVLVAQGAVREMEKGDIAIGLTGATRYQEHELTLEKGDLFILYSDGVIEARNEQGAFFGKERLIASLKGTDATAPEALCRRIVTEIDRFIGAERPSDDLSLVILRRL